MPKIAKLQSVDVNSVTFADPSDINHTFRVKNSRTPKNLQGVPLTNNRMEFIDNSHAVRISGDNVAKEPLSIRVIISGSIESETEVLQRWTDMKTNVDAAIVDGALKGFKPTQDTTIQFDIV